ncbi:hypothetical protein ACWDUM_20030 [Rhodococcus sp. NPDC003322]
MIRRTTAFVLVAFASTALLVAGPATSAEAATAPPKAGPGDRYVSNPPDDNQLVGYCSDQAQLANNLEMQGDHDRALNVVGAANMRGCRIYTFEASWGAQ